MNTKHEGLIYTVFALVIGIIIVTLLILIFASSASSTPDTPGFAVSDTPSDTSASDTVSAPDTTITPDTAKAPETSSSSDTTAAPDTTQAPETTAPREDAPSVEAPPANISAELADFLKNYPKTVLPESADAGIAYIDKIVFLGDSTTYGLRAYKMLAGGRDTLQVWTPKSGTLTLSQASFATIVYPETNEEITIKEAVSRKKPEYLVITLGVNGVSFMDEAYFKSEYKSMLETIIATSPNTKIICQSIFPVARTYPYLGSINNEKIRAANKWIVEVADAVGVKFVDTYSVLCDDEGWLPEAYHNGDGLHLNAESFTIELNNLRTHAYTD